MRTWPAEVGWAWLCESAHSGLGPLSAAAVISEIDADVRQFFPDAAHLASWAGLCPGNHESAGKRHSREAPPLGHRVTIEDTAA